jgi:hypothetical protein
MKRFTSGSIFVALLLMAAIVVASAPKKYGKDLTLTTATPIKEIMASPEKFNGKRVLVEGKVVDVCSKMGCWMKIDGGEGVEPMTIKVDDGVIVFPVEAKGKVARAEGIVSVKTMTQEELIAQAKHEAEVNKKSFDPATIKGPKVTVQIKGEGAVIEE